MRGGGGGGGFGEVTTQAFKILAPFQTQKSHFIDPISEQT